jgi:hypothetical protein
MNKYNEHTRRTSDIMSTLEEPHTKSQKMSRPEEAQSFKVPQP